MQQLKQSEYRQDGIMSELTTYFAVVNLNDIELG